MEARLLMADLGIEATNRIMGMLNKRARENKLNSEEELMQCLQAEMLEMLAPREQTLDSGQQSMKPDIILVVGVNGVGKTTTIGKIAHYFKSRDTSVLLAAGDTFRAAAIDQLQSWGEQNDIPVIAQQHGSDSAAVIFDALHSARARKCDLVIADTAGRLQNKDNLMEELKKIRRSIDKFDSALHVEVLLVIDAGTGQNALSQTKLFHEAIGVSGIALTKLDGTAKGGVVFALSETFEIPIRFIGLGEKIDDLRPFRADYFIKALLDIDQ